MIAAKPGAEDVQAMAAERCGLKSCSFLMAVRHDQPSAAWFIYWLGS